MYIHRRNNANKPWGIVENKVLKPIISYYTQHYLPHCCIYPNTSSYNLYNTAIINLLSFHKIGGPDGGSGVACGLCYTSPTCKM